MRRALFCDHACHVKSGQKRRKYNLKHLIHSHSNEEPSVILYFSPFFFQQRLSLLIDTSDRDFLNSARSQFWANIPYTFFFFPQPHFFQTVLRKTTTLSLFVIFSFP